MGAAVVVVDVGGGAQARLDALMAKGAAGAKRTEELQNQTVPAARRNESPEAIESDHSFYGEALGFRRHRAAVRRRPQRNVVPAQRKDLRQASAVAMAGDRVLVIYGAGHNYWLGHFARVVPGNRGLLQRTCAHHGWSV